MGLIGNFFNRLGGSALTETGITQALAAKGMTDAEGRSTIGGAASVAAGLRAIGLTVMADAPVPAPTPTPTLPAGFTMNGSTNTALRAAFARVKAGTGRATINQKGDSTTAGTGAAIIANGTSSSPADQMTGARPYRPGAAMAGYLTAAGVKTIDAGFVADNGAAAGAGISLPLYDPRVTFTGSAWTPAGGNNFAGGGYMPSVNGSTLNFAEVGNRLEVVLFDAGGGTIGITLDGAAVAASAISAPGGTVSGNNVTIPNSGAGFFRFTVSASGGAASHTWGLSSSNALLRSARTYTSTVAAMDIINHAVNGAGTADQSATGNGWQNNDALGFDAPDLTIINLGLNDARGGTTVSAYTTGLQAIIDKAKLSGDVLLVSPNPANPANFTSAALQTSFRDAASALAASNHVAYMDFYSYFMDWATFSNRSADQTVHPNRGAYDEIGSVLSRCLLAMAA